MSFKLRPRFSLLSVSLWVFIMGIFLWRIVREQQRFTSEHCIEIKRGAPLEWNVEYRYSNGMVLKEINNDWLALGFDVMFFAMSSIVIVICVNWLLVKFAKDVNN